MNVKMPPFFARILAIGILLGLSVFVGSIVIWPTWSRWQGQQNSIALSQRVLSAYRRAEALRPAMEGRFKDLQQRGASSTGLIEANSAALAAAKTQGEIRAIIEANGGQIHSSQSLSPSSIDEFEKISVAADFSVPLSNLTKLLYGIETHTPYLFVSKIEIRMPENWQPADENTQAPKLEVRCEISGYRWAGAK